MENNEGYVVNDASELKSLKDVAGVNKVKLLSHKASRFTKRSLTKLTTGFNKKISDLKKNVVTTFVKNKLNKFAEKVQFNEEEMIEVASAIEALRNNTLEDLKKLYPDDIKTNDDVQYFLNNLVNKLDKLSNKNDKMREKAQGYVGFYDKVISNNEEKNTDLETNSLNDEVQAEKEQETVEEPIVSQENVMPAYAAPYTESQEESLMEFVPAMETKESDAKVNGSKSIFVPKKYFEKMAKNAKKLGKIWPFKPKKNEETLKNRVEAVHDEWEKKNSDRFTNELLTIADEYEKYKETFDLNKKSLENMVNSYGNKNFTVENIIDTSNLINKYKEGIDELVKNSSNKQLSIDELLNVSDLIREYKNSIDELTNDITNGEISTDQFINLSNTVKDLKEQQDAYAGMKDSITERLNNLYNQYQTVYGKCEVENFYDIAKNSEKIKTLNEIIPSKKVVEQKNQVEETKELVGFVKDKDGKDVPIFRNKTIKKTSKEVSKEEPKKEKKQVKKDEESKKETSKKKNMKEIDSLKEQKKILQEAAKQEAEKVEKSSKKHK